MSQNVLAAEIFSHTLMNMKIYFNMIKRIAFIVPSIKLKRK